MNHPPNSLGRGPEATADMKARIKALRAEGADVLDTLWERNRQAVLGEGFRYDFAEPELVRSGR